MNLISADLTEKQFRKVSELVYQLCGIHLKNGKEALVRARLMKRLRALGMTNFEEYLRYIETSEGKIEIARMIDVMTTNKTSFFREPAHFHFLRDHVLGHMNARRLRFWTAACSSGEESYSLAILLLEYLPNIELKDVKILATDISTRMLDRAKRGVYPEDTLRDIPHPLRQKYFIRMRDEYPPAFRVKDNVRSLVKAARLNLIDPWPMKGLFNVIFCRNVMIYFDRQTQQRLINRFWGYLDSGGYLFVGHSEGLSAISHKFRYIRPAVYVK